MPMKFSPLVPLAAVIAVAGPVAAQTAMSAPAADAMPTDAPTYMMKAGASDQFEIQSSQLALQKSSSASIKRMSNMLIADHTKTTQTLMAAAQKAGMTPPPPPPLEPMQQQMMTELQGLSGSAFDATWLRQQGMAHQMALELHQNYAKNGDTPALKKAASSAVPIIKKHISMLQGAGAPM
jgi:putative membrane protein